MLTQDVTKELEAVMEQLQQEGKEPGKCKKSSEGK